MTRLLLAYLYEEVTRTRARCFAGKPKGLTKTGATKKGLTKKRQRLKALEGLEDMSQAGGHTPAGIAKQGLRNVRLDRQTADNINELWTSWPQVKPLPSTRTLKYVSRSLPRLE